MAKKSTSTTRNYKPYVSSTTTASKPAAQAAQKSSGSPLDEFSGDWQSYKAPAEGIQAQPSMPVSESIKRTEAADGSIRGAKTQIKEVRAVRYSVKLDTEKQKLAEDILDNGIQRAKVEIKTDNLKAISATVPLNRQLRMAQVAGLANNVQATVFANSMQQQRFLAQGVGGKIDFSQADQHANKEAEFVEATFDE